MKNQEELKSKISLNIRYYRKKAGLTQKQLAELLGVKNTAVSNWENGQNSIDTEILFRVCEVFGITLNDIYGVPSATVSQKEIELDLYEKLGLKTVSTQRLPILGNVACGEPIFAEETFEGYVTVGANIKADFCLRAQGNSMVNARIHDGDIVFVRKQDMVDDGEIAVVLVENEATIKRVYYDRENSTLTLVPENPAFKIMRFRNEELEQIRILGKVVAGQYDVQ